MLEEQGDCKEMVEELFQEPLVVSWSPEDRFLGSQLVDWEWMALFQLAGGRGS